MQKTAEMMLITMNEMILKMKHRTTVGISKASCDTGTQFFTVAIKDFRSLQSIFLLFKCGMES
jgi:hypothetical protein